MFGLNVQPLIRVARPGFNTIRLVLYKYLTKKKKHGMLVLIPDSSHEAVLTKKRS